MADKKMLYVHFDGSNYVNSKSELLKVQMEILYLKKKLKDLVLTRTNKLHYKKLLDGVVLSLRGHLESLDSLMPLDKEILNMKLVEENKTSKPVQRKKKVQELREPVMTKVLEKDEIEEELLKIKQKLDYLNSI